MTRDPWKLVTDEAQLRVGMCLEMRPCKATARTERFVLLRRQDGQTRCYPGNAHKTCRGWHSTAISNGSTVMCVAPLAIRERRLYALIDDDTAADETTVTRRRELVE